MHTVIGVFDDRVAASKALEILLTSGFETDHVHMQGRPFVSEPAGQPPEPEDKGDGFFGTMSHFFSSIFGDDHPAKSTVYNEAVRRGGYVVTVDADDDEEAAEVEQVLRDAGAVDLDQRVTEWKAQGWDVDLKDVATSDWHRTPRTPKGGI